MPRKKKESIECPICLQNVKNEIITDCNHSFCDICLVRNLIITNSCPMCRTLCNYDDITIQIGIKRQKIIMNKLKIKSLPQQPIIIQQQQQQIHTNIYSRFCNPILPRCIVILFVFVIEVILLASLFFYIIQKVKHINRL